MDKVYEVETWTQPSDADLGRLRTGVELDDGVTSPADVRRLAGARIELTIHEGRNRQVKRMFEAVGHRVRSLHRSRYGPLTLEGLEPGRWRELEPSEVERLRATPFVWIRLRRAREPVEPTRRRLLQCAVFELPFGIDVPLNSALKRSFLIDRRRASRSAPTALIFAIADSIESYFAALDPVFSAAVSSNEDVGSELPDTGVELLVADGEW